MRVNWDKVNTNAERMFWNAWQIPRDIKRIFCRHKYKTYYRPNGSHYKECQKCYKVQP